MAPNSLLRHPSCDAGDVRPPFTAVCPPYRRTRNPDVGPAGASVGGLLLHALFCGAKRYVQPLPMLPVLEKTPSSHVTGAERKKGLPSATGCAGCIQGCGEWVYCRVCQVEVSGMRQTQEYSKQGVGQSSSTGVRHQKEGQRKEASEASAMAGESWGWGMKGGAGKPTGRKGRRHSGSRVQEKL